MHAIDITSKVRGTFKNIPLRSFIIAPVALLFAASISITTYLSYQTSSKLIHGLLDNHSAVISKSISTQLDAFFSKAIQNTLVNKELIESGALNLDSPDAPSAHFLTQIKNIPYITFVSMGFPNGEYTGAGRQVATGEINLYTVRKSEGSAFNRHQVLEGNSRGSLIEKGVQFDATARGWYQTAVKQGKIHWYPVYKYASQDTLGVGVSAPVYDPRDNHLLGVLTTDMALNRISEFLKSTQGETDGIIFIAESSGELVATSSKKEVYYKTGANYKRFTTATYPDIRIQKAQKLIQAGKESQEGHVFKTNDRQYQFNYKIYKDELGQEFIIGIILSVDAFTHVYMVELYKRIIVGIIFLTIMGVLLILILQQIVLPPIKRLVNAQELIKCGDYTVRVPISKIREISVLTAGFNESVEALGKSKQIEKAYMDREKMAALGGLVSGITHEINTPLGVAITISSFIEKSHRELLTQISEGKISKAQFTAQSQEIQEDLAILQTQLSHSAELIKSFKGIAVGQTSEIEVRFNVKEVIGNVITSLKHEYKRKNHQFTIDCDDAFFINSYPGALTQILTNLVMNSLIHGFDKIDNGEIRITFKRDGKEILMIYEDNGKGMDRNTQEKMFVPFFTTKREEGGTGIGMNIIQNIVTEQLQGKIVVESEEGMGIRLEIKFSEK